VSIPWFWRNSWADILHCGDTYWNGIYPFIDYSTGGNIDGVTRAAEANVAAVTDKTIVIPGYGNPVSNKAELTASRHACRDPRELCGAQAAGALSRRHDRREANGEVRCEVGQFLVTPDFFTRLVYQGGEFAAFRRETMSEPRREHH
jgi:hypothetical protein